MKADVLEQKENPLLKRKDILLSIDFEGTSTPSKQSLKEELSKTFSAPAENIEIRKLTTEFGRAFGKAEVKVWEEKPPEKKKKAAAQAAAPAQ